ncbi:MAG: ABC transporter transmembrane domain-containing protein, partial [Bacillota bacterium]
MSTTSYTPGSSNPGVVRSLRRSFQLMRQRRTFLALSLCEVARGLVKVPLFALGLKWLTEGCLAQSGALLLRGLGTLVGAVVFATVTVMLTDYWSLQITARTKSEIRTRLINASLTSDLDRAGVETADLIYTLNSSVTELGQLYRATDAVIGTCGKVAGSLVTGFWLSPALSLLVLGLGLAKLGLDKYLLKPLQGVAAEIKGTESLLVKEIIEYLEGTAFFRIFGSSQRSTAQFAAYGQRFADATMREARLTALVTAVSKGIEFLTMLAILGLGGLAVVRGQMTLGSLTAFISIYDDLVNPYRRIGEFLKDFQTLSISSDRVQSVLASAVPATTTPRAAVVTLGSPFCLVAENLSFAYGGNRPILSNFSFEAP